MKPPSAELSNSSTQILLFYPPKIWNICDIFHFGCLWEFNTFKWPAPRIPIRFSEKMYGNAGKSKKTTGLKHALRETFGIFLVLNALLKWESCEPFQISYYRDKLHCTAKIIWIFWSEWNTSAKNWIIIEAIEMKASLLLLSSSLRERWRGFIPLTNLKTYQKPLNKSQRPWFL